MGTLLFLHFCDDYLCSDPTCGVVGIVIDLIPETTCDVLVHLGYTGDTQFPSFFSRLNTQRIQRDYFNPSGQSRNVTFPLLFTLRSLCAFSILSIRA